MAVVGAYLGLAACGQGRKVRFDRVTELITLLMQAKEEKQLLRFRKQIKQLDLIVLDELGYVPTGKVGAELRFDVLSTAYERQSLVVTTSRETVAEVPLTGLPCHHGGNASASPYDPVVPARSLPRHRGRSDRCGSAMDRDILDHRHVRGRTPRDQPARAGGDPCSPNRFDATVFLKFFVAGHERHIQRTGCRNDEPVRRVAVHRLCQTAGEDGDVGGDRLDPDFGQAVHICHPLLQRHAELQPAAANRSRDFEQTDGGDGDLARITMRCERPLGFPGKSWSTSEPPHQNMGIDDDQRFMSQSSAGKTGSNGLS